MTVIAAALPAMARAEEPPLLVLGAGAMDLRQTDTTMPEAEIQYRSQPLWWLLGAQVGVLANDKGTIYPWAGPAVTVPLGERLVLTPTFGAGYYEAGSGKALGDKLEFRSAVELAYRFDNRMRLGLELYHLSNAGIGIRNPGIEGAALTLAVPLSGPGISAAASR